jgi:hypothetical protein
MTQLPGLINVSYLSRCQIVQCNTFYNVTKGLIYRKFAMGSFSTWLYDLFIKIFVYCIIIVQIANKEGFKIKKKLNYRNKLKRTACNNCYVTLGFFYLVCEAIGTAATPGLLCQPRVIVRMIVEKQWNVYWQGKPKFSEKTAPEPLLSITKPHMTRPGFEPGPPRWEAGD